MQKTSFRLLIATTNPGKLTEIKAFLSDLPLELVDLRDTGITDNPRETGQSFEENAVLKARFYAQKTGLATLADDGGLEIDALGGEPGVKSHRWIGGDRDDSDEALIKYTLKRMKGLHGARRGAQLRLVLALAFPDGDVHTAEGLVRGVIANTPSRHRTRGFPFRALLFLPHIDKYYNYDELTQEENDRYNHRKRALEKLKPIIKQRLCSISNS